MVEKLPLDAEERNYFETDQELRRKFPSRHFNCWGVPVRAEPSFIKTQVGDLVLILPTIGQDGGGIYQLGIVKAKCHERCYNASRVLWPNTPEDRLFPFLFFFDTEIGFRSWPDFLNDMEIASTWDPRGWYRPIALKRFNRWGGAEGYLKFLRDDCDFKALKSDKVLIFD
jgi:hypothetical protein